MSDKKKQEVNLIAAILLSNAGIIQSSDAAYITAAVEKALDVAEKLVSRSAIRATKKT